MTILLLPVPVAVLLDFAGLAAFLWALRSGQFEDAERQGWRVLIDDDDPD